jgi:hypothetical protein
MIMGGFHYFEGSDKAGAQHSAVHPLTHEDIISMLKNTPLSLPTEQELHNQSKSDGLAKTLVFLQTLWFVTQCIARRVENLPTTELEIVTLAYTTINVGIFLAWWDKPRNVDCPIRVFQGQLEVDHAEKWIWIINVANAIMGRQDELVDLHRCMKVPMFYSGKPKENEVLIADSITLAAGVVFGAIHCVAWSFTFSSHTEAFLWRLSSVAITAVPVLLFVTPVLFNLIRSLVDDDSWWLLLPVLVFFICLSLSGPLYIAARLTTLVLAFINLSSLPPGAFQAVHWTTLLPHL